MPSQRLNLVLPERTVQRLEALKTMTDAASVSEVIRRALMTYTSIAAHLSQGSIFYIRKPSGELVEVEFMIDAPKPFSVIDGGKDG